jgi:B-cell receptor-associated protein 31
MYPDAVRDVTKYSKPLDDADMKVNPAAETTLHMKLFRAQRNLYIAGFALFLFV